MIYIGTSGYNYPEWKGTFYPSDLAAAKMLPYYAERLSTVEINYTFYRMPNEKIVAGWAAQTPAHFKFTLKAPRRITHDSRLRGSESALQRFCEVAGTLGDRLGALLFQLPPNFRKDLGCLEAFLAALPRGARAAFEFRHASWHDEDVFAALRAHHVALCIADSEKMSTPVVNSAAYGYLRLRDAGYQDEDLARWADVIVGHLDAWSDVFVYFKHEEAGTGPVFAAASLACSDLLQPGR